MAESFMDQMDLILLESIEQYVRACSQSSDIDKRTSAKHAVLLKIFGPGSKQVTFLILVLSNSTYCS